MISSNKLAVRTNFQTASISTTVQHATTVSAVNGSSLTDSYWCSLAFYLPHPLTTTITTTRAKSSLPAGSSRQHIRKVPAIYVQKIETRYNSDVIFHSYWCQLFWPPSCGARKCTHFQHLQSDRRSGANTKLFSNLIQFHLNNVNFAQYDVMPYNMEIVSWP